MTQRGGPKEKGPSDTAHTCVCVDRFSLFFEKKIMQEMPGNVSHDSALFPTDCALLSGQKLSPCKNNSFPSLACMSHVEGISIA